MIPKQFDREQLLGHRCHPVHRIKSVSGVVITPDHICRIDSFVCGKDDFTIRTEKCPLCHKYTYMSGISSKDLQLVELARKDIVRNKSQCGQTCWVVERDKDGKASKLGRYIFIAQIPGYAIMTPTINGRDDVQVLMDDQVRQTAEDYHGDLAVFPAEDVYVERQKAQEALDNAIKEE